MHAVFEKWAWMVCCVLHFRARTLNVPSLCFCCCFQRSVTIVSIFYSRKKKSKERNTHNLPQIFNHYGSCNSNLALHIKASLWHLIYLWCLSVGLPLVHLSGWISQRQIFQPGTSMVASAPFVCVSNRNTILNWFRLHSFVCYNSLRYQQI